MEGQLWRAYLIELAATAGFVFVSSAVVCVQQMAATPTSEPGPLTIHQPGLLGVALVQGLMYAAMLSISARRTGGYLHPGITLASWILQRVDSTRTAWLLGAQLTGSVAGAGLLRLMFGANLLRAAHGGTPFLNPLAFPDHGQGQGALLTAALIELLLTFFVALAIFATTAERRDVPMAGAALAACVAVGLPLTGAALNPVRWFGPILWESLERASTRSPAAESLVYLAGPIVGALLAAAVHRTLWREEARK